MLQTKAAPPVVVRYQPIKKEGRCLANTIIQKIELAIMKWYVNYMYDKALKETRCLELGKEKLQKLLNKLILLSAF